MLTRADSWVAHRLMSPIMAVFLTITRQSKIATSRLFWFLVALDGYYNANSLLALIVFSSMAVFMLVAASLQAEAKTRSRIQFRMLGFCLLIVFLARGLITGTWQGTEFWVFVTLAQYAIAVPNSLIPVATSGK